MDKVTGAVSELDTLEQKVTETNLLLQSHGCLSKTAKDTDCLHLSQ